MILKIKIKTLLTIISVFLIFFTIGCANKNSENYSKNNIKNNLLYKKNILEFNEENIQSKYENIYFNQKYYSKINNINSNKALIYIGGGPDFYKNNLDVSTIQKYIPNFNFAMYKALHNENPFLPVIGYRDNIIKKIETKLNNFIKPQKLEVYNFLPSQLFIVKNPIKEKISLKRTEEIQLASILALNKLINELVKNNKEIYLYGFSYGGSIVYDYISKYKNKNLIKKIIIDSNIPDTKNFYFENKKDLTILKENYNSDMPLNINDYKNLQKKINNLSVLNAKILTIEDVIWANINILQKVANGLIDLNFIKNNNYKDIISVFYGGKDSKIYANEFKTNKLVENNLLKMKNLGFKIQKFDNLNHGLRDYSTLIGFKGWEMLLNFLKGNNE